MKHRFGRVILLAAAVLFTVHAAAAQNLPSMTLRLSQSSDPTEVVPTLQIIGLMTLMALAPALVLMMTSFTRILIVMHFLRQAMGANQVPPAQLVVGLSLILSFFVMAPTLNTVNDTALKPYMAKTIDQKTALENAAQPFKDFMLRQVRERDLALFVNLSGQPRPENISDIGLAVLVPAFVISELRIAFQIGFVLYLPFLIIDMVVSSVLLAMGMMMLPPVMISLPFKILLFVMVDGWYLIVESLVKSFH
ncbi:MAG: flagellar type III secretion system pore protein FliP [Calditrichota bacterium]